MPGTLLITGTEEQIRHNPYSHVIHGLMGERDVQFHRYLEHPPRPHPLANYGQEATAPVHAWEQNLHGGDG